MLSNEVEILVVEDNPSDLDLTLRALKEQNVRDLGANKHSGPLDRGQALDRATGSGSSRSIS